MAEMITGGVPTNSSSLNDWNSNGVSVIDNPTYNKVFAILPGGFLNQFKYASGTMSSININITYNNSSDENINGMFVVYTNSDNNVSIALLFEPTGTEFETLSLQISTTAEEVKQIAFELTNNSNKNMYVAGISADCSLSSGNSGSVDTTDYMQEAIMFGTDANKPALR